MNNIILKFVLWISWTWFFLLNNFWICLSWDVLEDVYSDSTSSVAMVEWDKVVWDSDSMLVKATNLLLTLTITIWVSMIMYGGIMIILSMWDQSKMQKARTNLIYVIVGILLAMSSVGIITIMRSVAQWDTIPGWFYFYHNLI